MRLRLRGNLSEEAKATLVNEMYWVALFGKSKDVTIRGKGVKVIPVDENAVTLLAPRDVLEEAKKALKEYYVDVTEDGTFYLKPLATKKAGGAILAWLLD